jgi:hypothetical protein
MVWVRGRRWNVRVKVRSIVICCMAVRDRGCFEEVEWKGETA